MKHVTYDHLSGAKKIPSAIRSEIEQAITAISVKPAAGAASKIRAAFLNGIGESGWPGEVPVCKDTNITVTSVKSDVGLCFQTGNVARIYADMLKLQTMYINSAIKSAVIVVPSYPVAKKLGSNIANSRRLENELRVFSLAYSVPTLVYSLE